MINIVALNVTNILDVLEKGLLKVSDEDLKKAKKYIYKEDQARSLGASLLINKFTGDGPLLFTKEGKPYKENDKKFSISHSGDYAIISISDVEIGIDIQKIVKAETKLIDFCLTDKEINQVKSNDDFARIWTLKESLVKCYGTGFNKKPNQFQTAEVDNQSYKFNDEDYVSLSTRFKNDYFIGVTYKSDKVDEICFKEITLDELI